MSQNQEIKKFIKRGALFCLPLFLFFAISFLLLLKSGELNSPDQIIQFHQNSRSSLVGFAYSDPFRYFKLQSVLNRKPEIIMLGSSHTGYFRSVFFNSPDVFYNANIIGSQLQDFYIFLKHLPTKDQPKIILLGLDPAPFNQRCSSWHDYQELNQQYSSTFNASNPLHAWQFGYLQIYQDYLAGKFSLRDLPKLLHHPSELGLNAIVNQTGYVWDGTLNNTKDTFRRLTESDQSFKERTMTHFFGNEPKQKCPEMAARTTAEVKRFLAESQSRKILVVGFITPYTQALYRQMKQIGHQYDYLFNLGSSLRPLFNQFGFHLYDFSDSTTAHLSDQEMMDEDHPSEKASLKIFLQMRAHEPALWPYTNAPHLEKRLNQAPNHLFVFDKSEF